MSCYIVEPEHIAELVKHFQSLGAYKPSRWWNLYKGEQIKFREEFSEPVNVAFHLAFANIYSYNSRYPDSVHDYKRTEEDIHFLEMVENAMKTPKNHLLKWNELINMCNCLDYQSCDFNDYTKTDAYFILETIKGAFVNAWSRQETDEETQISWGYPMK